MEVDYPGYYEQKITELQQPKKTPVQEFSILGCFGRSKQQTQATIEYPWWVSYATIYFIMLSYIMLFIIMLSTPGGVSSFMIFLCHVMSIMREYYIF